MATVLLWLNSHRLHDNPAVLAAAQEAVAKRCSLVCATHYWPFSYQRGITIDQAWSNARKSFYQQSLSQLADALAALGQTLYVSHSRFDKAIFDTLENVQPISLHLTEPTGFDEKQTLKSRSQQCSAPIHQHWGYTLFKENELPFSLNELPNTFTQFRKQLEPLGVIPVSEPPLQLPLAPSSLPCNMKPWTSSQHSEPKQYPIAQAHGGEKAGLKHLNHYLHSEAPQHYKKTRNCLTGWDTSTKLSPWLATGALSPRLVLDSLRDHEREYGKNDSTYWISFELLWREYFQWYAKHHGASLFTFSGITRQKPLTSFYPERFNRWKNGTTPYPIVNACMNELRATGFLSNRGRQIAASCLVNELNMDWRYGAAWFENQLIDYDVASNWGNWQYIAGVGADPRGGRHFNLAKQESLYDPKGNYRAQWSPPHSRPTLLDSTDAADWPRFE